MHRVSIEIQLVRHSCSYTIKSHRIYRKNNKCVKFTVLSNCQRSVFFFPFSIITVCCPTKLKTAMSFGDAMPALTTQYGPKRNVRLGVYRVIYYTFSSILSRSNYFSRLYRLYLRYFSKYYETQLHF